jgi:hypothetical protein
MRLAGAAVFTIFRILEGGVAMLKVERGLDQNDRS